MRLQLEDDQVKQAIILAIVLIIVVPISLFLSYGIGAVEVISVISSSLLSLGLVILYFRQQSTMEKQTKLMNREYISNLHFAPSALADGDELIFELKNTGRGKVRHIQMESEIDDIPGSVEIEAGETSLSNYENGDFELEPNSGYKRYSGKPKFINPRIAEDRELPFKFASSPLSSEDIDKCRLKVHLKVTDESLESPHTFEIANQEIGIGGTIEEGIEHEYSSSQDINKKSFEDEFDQ